MPVVHAGCVHGVVLPCSAILAVLLGCDGTDVPEAPDAADGRDAGILGVPVPVTEVRFEASSAALLNPERGLYLAGQIAEDWNFSRMRERGFTLTYAGVDLDPSGPIPGAMLTTLAAGLARVRTAGLKIIVRFAYNSGAGMPDAPLARVLGHIQQLTPLLRANADVIVALEAGFIGEWGEWHHSTHGLDTPAARKAIVEAELAALPPARSVMLRTPMYKDESWGGPLAEADAFGGSADARLGQHNDCFLATDSDYGTYAHPVESWKDFVAQEGRFTPVSGGPCRVFPPRSLCPTALAELARLHYSMLSSRGNDAVWDRWKLDGCADEIARKVGYRFELRRALFNEQVAPGGALALEVHLRNVGYASPFNPRPVHVVLEGGGARRTVALEDVDPRRWEPGAEHAFSVRVRLPANLVPGAYRLGLWLPDAAPGLQGRAEYAIQLANEGVWDAASATNILTGSLTIDPLAPGEIDPSATALVQLP